MTLRPSEVLDKAADLIEPEGAWTQGTWARDASGSDNPDPTNEVCWCGWGAIYKVAGYEWPRYALEAAGFADRTVGAACGAYQVWNDAPERTQIEAVAALRKAAELARSEGQ